MIDIEVKTCGYFDQNRDDLIKLLPKFEGLNKIKILDISCKTDGLKRFYKSFNKTVEIVEIDREKQDIKNILNHQNKFDIISIRDEFSSFINPDKVLKKIYNSLSDEGFLIFTVPNIINYGVIYSLLMGKWQYSDDEILNRKNLRFYNLEEIGILLKDTGFVIDEVYANFSPYHEMVDKMSSLIEYLGGDTACFKKNALVYQYFIRVKKGESSYNYDKDLFIKNLHLEAYEHYKNKKYDSAIKCYLLILKTNENDENAIFGLAKCFELTQKYDLAFKCYRQIADIYPTEKNVIEFAYYNVRRANHKEVVSILEPFIKKHATTIDYKTRAKILKVIGNALMNIGDLDKARQYYLEAKPVFMSLEEERGVILVNLGTLEIQKGNMVAAMSYFKEAIGLREELGKAYTGLGMIELLGTNNKKALDFFCKALDEDPTCINAIYNLIQVAFEFNKNDIAVKYIDNYLKYKPDDYDMKYTLAGLYFELMDFERARIICREILEVNSDHENAKELMKSLNKSIQDKNKMFKSCNQKKSLFSETLL